MALTGVRKSGVEFNESRMIRLISSRRLSVMKVIFLSLFMVFIATTAQAMDHLSASDFAAAQDEAQQQLKTLNKDFHIEIRERFAASGGTAAALEPGVTPEDGSILLAAEVETLPGAEIAEPWILASPKPATDVVNREQVSFEQLR
jgi:hypothetical protein